MSGGSSDEDDVLMGESDNEEESEDGKGIFSSPLMYLAPLYDY